MISLIGGITIVTRWFVLKIFTFYYFSHPAWLQVEVVATAQPIHAPFPRFCIAANISSSSGMVQISAVVGSQVGW